MAEERITTEEALSSVSDVGHSILKDLLFNQYQMILAGGAAAASLLTLNPLPILIWLGGECILIPLLDTPIFRRMVNLKKAGQLRQRAAEARERMVQSLDPMRSKRYQELKDLCRQIESNYSTLSGISKVYLSEQSSKMDAILNGCLQRLVALFRYEKFLEQRDSRSIRNAIERLERELTSPGIKGRAREALEKNLSLKKRLLDSQNELESTQIALAAELDSLASLLELLHQKSIALRDPQAISQELDAIVKQVEHTEASIKEMESYFSDDSLGLDSSLSVTA